MTKRTSKTASYLKSAMLFAICILPNPILAQTVHAMPYAGEQEITSRLFNLDEASINYQFTAELPGGNFLIIEWNHLSDWTNKADLQHIISLAKTYASQVQDSFKAATTAKRLDVHIPIDNEPVTVMLREHKAKNNVLLLNAGMESPLKVNMDTIRVLKTIGEGIIKTTRNNEVQKEHQLIQMQYTFLLKDVDDIKALDDDKTTTTTVGEKFDSVVNRYKHKWHKEDKWTHNLTVNYFPLSEDPKKRLTIIQTAFFVEKGRFCRAIELDAGLGATLFRNTVCPNLDGGISYKWPRRNNNNMYDFARLSGSSFSLFTVQIRSDYRPNQFIFGNVELGWLRTKSSSLVPFYGASVGIGYGGISFPDPAIPSTMFRYFFNYRISKMFTITLDQYEMYSYGAFNSVTATLRLL